MAPVEGAGAIKNILEIDNEQNSGIYSQIGTDKLSMNDDLDLRLESIHLKYRCVEGGDQAQSLSDYHKALNELIVDQQSIIQSLNRKIVDEIYKQESISIQNITLRKKLIQIQSETEQEEEFISNKFLKKIDKLKSEKQDLLLKLEAEEEIISNQLQKKLFLLQKEKIEMEISLEQEQESMVNRLQKQLDNLRVGRKRLNSEENLNLSRNYSSTTMSKSNSWNSSHELPPSKSVVESLKAENLSLVRAMNDARQEATNYSVRIREIYSKLYQVVQEIDLNLVNDFPSILDELTILQNLNIREPLPARSQSMDRDLVKATAAIIPRRLSGRLPFV